MRFASTGVLLLSFTPQLSLVSVLILPGFSCLRQELGRKKN